MFGLKVPFSGIDLRGPSGNCHTTLSVSPLKWQLEQLCQPSLDRRPSVDTVAPAGRSKWPREEKNISAPTATTSSSDPGVGSLPVRMTFTTWSVLRFTTLTLRETKFMT